MLVIAIVGLSMMLCGVISVSMVPVEVRDGIASYAQGAEAVRSAVWLLVVGFTTAALGGVLWVVTRASLIPRRRPVLH